MKFVKKEFCETLEEKKSKFVTYLFPYSEFNEVMKKLKEEHPKARHHVYAYRYLNEFEQIVENCSDDGEPKGTSGKPSLAVLGGNELINSAVIIVRYFGGVKLGTGGLVRAYSDAVNKVISSSVLEKYEKLIELKLVCSYHELSKVEYLIKQEEIQIQNKEFSNEVELILQSNEEKLELLKKSLPRSVKIC